MRIKCIIRIIGNHYSDDLVVAPFDLKWNTYVGKK